MSHISSYRAELKLEGAGEEELARARELLKQAVETVAEEHDGFATTEITDFFGRKTAVEAGLITRQFPAGIGVRVNERAGEVEFLYDAYGGYQGVIRRLCDEIRQNYLALAVSRALKDLHYDVAYEEGRHEDTGGRRVVVRGVL